MDSCPVTKNLRSCAPPVTPAHGSRCGIKLVTLIEPSPTLTVDAQKLRTNLYRARPSHASFPLLLIRHHTYRCFPLMYYPKVRPPPAVPNVSAERWKLPLFSSRLWFATRGAGGCGNNDSLLLRLDCQRGTQRGKHGTSGKEQKNKQNTKQLVKRVEETLKRRNNPRLPTPGLLTQLACRPFNDNGLLPTLPAIATRQSENKSP